MTVANCFEDITSCAFGAMWNATVSPLRVVGLMVVVTITTATTSRSADAINSPPWSSRKHSGSLELAGRASVIDGRTLLFPEHGLRVTLAGVDGCDLPQWAFNGDVRDAAGDRLKPVPCGAFAKAWLKRSIGAHRVECRIGGRGYLRTGRCRAGGRDLAFELLRVGWARVAPGNTAVATYRLAQSRAMDARYGMWGTYVLDMNEWRQKAIDRTPSRRPVADYNLLRQRRAEISPPFVDAKRSPKRTDR
ncbi:thermonuclease family protein [Rhizobium grahamii]|uniref:Nuclease n=1 Tax=Rhizobium grahamii CCGE 502 TaxID=990285 RepID=S3ID44_9HYPH|nr:thermonuclease family protein [Rhizobium grahamii]EPE97068.1 nuclease [Rhizobium grahamii CCGE 502]